MAPGQLEVRFDPARSSRLMKHSLAVLPQSSKLHQPLLHSPDAAFSLPGAVRLTYVGNLRERSFLTVCIGCKLCTP
jgi:hypothetical protein